jgi:hydroxyethylthiazole kinase-like uncharacterized protein yjeF
MTSNISSVLVPNPESHGDDVQGLVLRHHWPQRPRNSHKGLFGSVGILGGAAGMGGAPLLSAMAALKSGAGRVWVACLDDSPGLQRAPEIMTATPDALLHNSTLTALVVGPGMGTSSKASALLDRALAAPCPLVLDADALNLLSEDSAAPERLRLRPAPTLLTPHPGEAQRLMGEPVADRVHTALTLAQHYNALVNLKGSNSVIATPQGYWWINPTGNAALSAAGMGDVLSGVIGALLGQGLSPLAALQLAIYAHGAAADRCVAQGLGPVGVTASEITNEIRNFLNER